MQEIIISKNEEGYKLRKLCLNYLNAAPASFIYKMLRKKNIVLNDKKATGDEVLKLGDSVKFYMKDETIAGFQKNDGSDLKEDIDKNYKQSQKSRNTNTKLEVIYEDEDFLFVFKPAGVLSQKAKETDYSINEMIIDYLLNSGAVTNESMKIFRPSVCNRLDRNTSGLILAAKTPKGAQYLTKQIRERRIKKYYLAAVNDEFKNIGLHTAYLTKDEKTNKVLISPDSTSGSSEIKTKAELISYDKKLNCSLLRIELITGKSHQIRAHLAYLGNPIIGDPKYGDAKVNSYFRSEYKVKSQMLMAYAVNFPEDDETSLSGKEFMISSREPFTRIFEI